MKKFLLGAAALTLAFASCKKDDNNSSTPTTPTSTNTVKIGSTTYNYGASNTAFARSGRTLSIAAVNSASTSIGLALYFPDSTAPAAGTYRVVSADSIFNLRANQVAIVATTTTGTSTTFYESTGAGTVNAVVSLVNNKYTIKVTDAPAVNTTNASETPNISVDVTEK